MKQERNYRILQLDRECDGYRSKAFEPWRRMNGKFDFADYREVYEGDLNGCESDKAACEKLFGMFQGPKPEGYLGHSLSVSDVVVIDGSKAYYCDSFGFVDVTRECGMEAAS